MMNLGYLIARSMCVRSWVESSGEARQGCGHFAGWECGSLIAKGSTTSDHVLWRVAVRSSEVKNVLGVHGQLGHFAT